MPRAARRPSAPSPAPSAARGFLAFRARCAEVYQTLENSFIRAPRPTPLGLVLAGGLSALVRAKPFETLWRELGSFFEDPRLRQLFGRYATYCGSSPFLAPATLMLVAHVELEGVWRVGGGMQRLPEAMARLAADKGTHFRTSERVTAVDVDKGRAAGVVLQSGERLAARAVVLNADVSALARAFWGRSRNGSGRSSRSRSVRCRRSPAASTPRRWASRSATTTSSFAPTPRRSSPTCLPSGGFRANPPSTSAPRTGATRGDGAGWRGRPSDSSASSTRRPPGTRRASRSGTSSHVFKAGWNC